jgi:hypothetical protein
MRLFRLCFVIAALLVPVSFARAGVVINEIFYHAPDDLDDIQWIELHNPGAAVVDLGGWHFDSALGFTFAKGTSIEADGYLVVARNTAHFQQIYGVKALGPLEKPLGRSGGKIELFDGAGKRVDAARYRDRAPWPVAADGYSASLERISPSASGEMADNWAASPLPANAPKPSGTPGKKNSCYSATLPPVIGAVTVLPDDPLPFQPLRVEVEMKGKNSPKEVTLLYRVASGGIIGKEASLPMMRNETSGKYVATIPAQKADTLVRYRIKARDQAGAQRLFPAENDLCPMMSAYVHAKWDLAKISFGQIIHVHTTPPGGRGRGMRMFGMQGDGEDLPARGRGAPPVAHPPRGSSAFVYVDPKSGKTTLFDYVNIIPRDNGRGYKVHFHKNHTLNGLSVVSIIFEGSERFLLAEALAYDVYRRAGNAASQTEFMRLWVDGRMVGYHLMIEQPNRSFLRRNGLKDDGNLYKLLWYGGDLVGQHEKKTNIHGGHDDLKEVVALLQKTRGEEQWKVIQDNFNVNQMATYFAVNMVLSHWDGFFNNYFTYHDIHGSKKWEIYPWDQDKTWGFYDGIGYNEVFYNMPLNFGAAGARTPNGGSGFMGGGLPWWRDGGFFSAPLLANSQFRKVFLARTKEILEKVYTKENYFPLMDDLAERLKADVFLRSGEGGVAELTHNVKALKTHLEKRREFLLEQPELMALEKAPATRKATGERNGHD